MRAGRHPGRAPSDASAATGPIVCGVDGTPSAAVVRFAARLALRARSPLTIVQATRPESAAPRQVPAQSGRAGTIVLDGDPADSIVAVAREQDASLVVVGSRGGGQVHPAVPGSVSRDVIRRTDRPVLVVGDHHRLAGDRPWRVIAGVDPDNRPDRVTRDAAALAAALGSRLTLVHVGCPPPATAIPARTAGPCAADPLRRPQEATWLARLAEEARSSGIAVDTVVCEGPVVDELLRSARDAEPCFVVVGGSRRRGAVASAALGSVSSALLGSGACPLLLASPPPR